MASRHKPAPPMTSQVVPQGQSARMAKGREAKRKAEANKAAVDRINARKRAADACDLGKDGSPPSTNGSLPTLSTKDRLDLYERAKKERAEANAAALLGKPVPATPSLDELKRRQDMESKNGKAKQGRGPKVVSPRLAKANEARAKAKGKRGRDGKTVTDQELLDHIHAVRKAHPGTELVTERRYALFVENLSFSQGRWASMWALAEKGTTTAPESKTARKSPAKAGKAAVKTAPKGTEARKPASKVSGAVKKQTPGAKARENATKAAAEKRQAKKVARSTPKPVAGKAASTSPKAQSRSGSSTRPAAAKATSSGGPSGRDTKMVTTHFKEDAKKSA